MPELPEVEYAASQLRDSVTGHTIAAVEVWHPAHIRALPPADQQALVGEVIVRIERRAKVQLLHLASGSVLEVHFRMTGDWRITRTRDDPPSYERVRFETTDGVRVSLVDPRALSVVRLHRAHTFTPPDAGPEPLTDQFTVAGFRNALARRRAAIKSVLLDQRVVAGIGNIYASEALWEARIHPGTPAHRLRGDRLARLHEAIRFVLSNAPAMRYYASRENTATTPASPDRDTSHGGPAGQIATGWRVYDREDEPCPRCTASIRRIVQVGRSTYYCPRCQR